MIGRQQKEKKKTWKISLFLFIIILMTTIIGVCVVAQYQSEQYADNVLRLHVIANSNTSEDQALKLKVRDSVGSVVSMLTKNTRTAAETEQIVQENIDIIKTAAEEKIREEGYHYPVEIITGNFYFPTKYYAKGALPEKIGGVYYFRRSVSPTELPTQKLIQNKMQIRVLHCASKS